MAIFLNYLVLCMLMFSFIVALFIGLKTTKVI